MKKQKTYKVGLYLRLSKDDGDNVESQSIANQRIILESYLKNSKDQLIVVNEYVDDGYSGSNFERPAWKQLMMDVNNKKIDTVITKDLSRMGRDYIGMGQYIEREFPEKGIRYIAKEDDIDTLYETPGLEYLQFKLMFNDLYLKDVSKKIRRVVSSKKEKGEYLGWKGLYGYKRDSNNKHKLIVDEEVRHIVERMFNLVLEGYSPRQIANKFSEEGIPNPSSYANLKRETKTSASHLWCPRTVEELLINPTYIGSLTQGKRKKLNYKSKKEVRLPKEDWIIVENTHEAIIDKKTFETVQDLLSKNKHKKSSRKVELLQGFLKCKECNHVISINRSRDNKRKYCTCSFYLAHSKFKLCTPHSCNYEKLEKLVLDDLRENCKRYVDPSNFEEMVTKAKNKIDSKAILTKQLEQLKIKERQVYLYIDKIYEDKLNDIIDIDMYNRNSIKYKNELKDINKRITETEKQLSMINPANEKKERVEMMLKIQEYLNFENPNRTLISNLIDMIYLSQDKTIEIYYKFKVL